MKSGASSAFLSHHVGEALPPEPIAALPSRWEPVDRSAADVYFPQQPLVAVNLDLEIGVDDRDLARYPDLYVVLRHRGVVAESGAGCQPIGRNRVPPTALCAGLFGLCSLVS